MSGRRAAAGWARRGHAALSLEVSARERTRAKLQRRRAACVCVHASCVQTPFSAQPASLRLLPGQKPTGFAMICAGFFAATEPHSEQPRWMDAGKGVERRG